MRVYLILFLIIILIPLYSTDKRDAVVIEIKDFDSVVLRISNEEIRVGNVMKIMRRGIKIKHPGTGAAVTTQPEFIATVVIKYIDSDNTCIVNYEFIIDRGRIQKGDYAVLIAEETENDRWLQYRIPFDERLFK